jgi:hypothetical protein
MQHTVADEPDSLSDETLIAYVRGRLPDANAARIAAVMVKFCLRFCRIIAAMTA